jgi:hypothetical protein
VTAIRPAMARRRQLIAPTRRSQAGITASAGADTVTGAQNRPGLYPPAARASACSLIVAYSSAVIAPAAWS